MRNGGLGQQLLIESCQRVFFPSHRLPSLIDVRSRDQWESIVDLACRLGMASVLFDAVESTPTSIPDASLRRLRYAFQAEVVRHEVVVAPTLDATLRTLSEAGLSPIVIKGGSVAYTVYPHPTFRSFSDIDVLLPHDQLETAWQSLINAGFERFGIDPPAVHHMPALISPIGKMCVELHHQLLDGPPSILVDLDTLIARSRTTTLGNASSLVLSPEDELILACLHVSFAHHYRRNVLRGVMDLLGIATVHRYELDWGYVVSIANQLRATGAVFWPLVAARELLEAPVPDDVMQELASSLPLRWLLKAGTGPSSLAGADTRRFHSPLRQLLVLGSLYTGRSSHEFMTAAISGVRSVLRPSW